MRYRGDCRMLHKSDNDFRSTVFWWAAALSVLCMGVFAYELYSPGPGVKTWRAMSLDERGEFISGFFSPLAMIWALVAVILQQRALSLQKKEMELQRREVEEQTKIFKDEVRNMERSDFRGHLASLERQLQRHALMIREYAEPSFSRYSLSGYGEAEVEGTIQILQSLDQRGISRLTEGNKQSLADRMCSYVARFEHLKERALACGLEEDYSYYRRYTPYGHLLMSCRTKLQSLAKYGIKSSRHWRYDDRKRRWVKNYQEKIKLAHDSQEDPVSEYS